ncbi:MAG: hypothetical protein ACKOAG_12680, partial [Candidatus Kapaibacterium sp.]
QTRMFTAAPAQARPGYSISVHPVTRAVTISHPERGSIDIPGEELLSFLETVRSTIVGSHGKH